MTNNESKHALPLNVVEEFCRRCDWAHEVWLNHRELFDDNPRNDELSASFAGPEFARLSVISHEYSLLQIRKLHDKATIGRDKNLSINYVLEEGRWPESVRSQLKQMADKMEIFAKQLNAVRNKVLVHNDLKALMSGETLGAFAPDAEVPYFETLQEFVHLVHDQTVGGIRPFDTSVKNDVAAFLETVNPARALANRLTPASVSSDKYL